MLDLYSAGIDAFVWFRLLPPSSERLQKALAPSPLSPTPLLCPWIKYTRDWTLAVVMEKGLWTLRLWLWAIRSYNLPLIFRWRAARESCFTDRLVLTNRGVGKTSLLQRYTQGKFDSSQITSTTGAFFVTKKVFVDGLKVRLQLWDTAGQERFRSMVGNAQQM